ncbi:hypothetical protein O181_078408 [Austropuccinia psidii MF-1]|uniref:GAG-pre-integrase domain-containing protein n=1 Tax=Austropuccinia psidii MF-1 TaxID=1389203 RepID=A0A9Q3FIX5_9BASI|nr:hypothetical protein [Austropuccinia psidii MF-1]
MPNVMLVGVIEAPLLRGFSAHPPNTTQPTEDELSDSGALKVKVNQLKRTNWVQWKCHMTNYLNKCGYGCLFHAPSEKEKVTTNLQHKNSAGLAILWTTVSEELQGILLENDDLFFTAWNALGDVCGKNSTVTICQAFNRLTSLVYEPGSSLDQHIDLFLKLYSRRENVSIEALYINNKNQENQGSSKKPNGNKQSTLSTAQGEGDNRKRQNHKKKRRENTGNNAESVSKHLEKLEMSKNVFQSILDLILLRTPISKGTKALVFSTTRYKPPSPPTKEEDIAFYLALSYIYCYLLLFASCVALLYICGTLLLSTLVTTRPSIDQKAEKEHCSSEIYAYYLPSESIYAIDYQNRETLYLDTGCGHSVVNSLVLLSNVIKVRKDIKTFGSPVEVNHQGTLNLFGYHIAPVLFAPKGPVNLISVSQLVNRGIKPHYKNNNFLIKQGNSIITTFTQDGNLYSNRNQSCVNLAEIREGRDWHTLMGHPNDKYLECFLTKLGITKRFTSSKDCEICLKSKIQRTSHKELLTQTSFPFFKIHSDTLEISPPTKRGYRYILVLIDDYTRFNCIYFMHSKDQS